MLITSQFENRNGEEKHLALNLANVMSTTEPMKVVDLAVFSSTHEEGTHHSSFPLPLVDVTDSSQQALCSSLC